MFWATLSEVYRFAFASGKAERNIALDIKGALQPVKKKHLAAVTEPKRVGELLRMIERYSGTLTVQCALKLAPLVFVRPVNCDRAWEDIDLETQSGAIPSPKPRQSTSSHYHDKRLRY